MICPEMIASGGARAVSPSKRVENMPDAVGKKTGFTAPERAKSSHRLKKIVKLATVTAQVPYWSQTDPKDILTSLIRSASENSPECCGAWCSESAISPPRGRPCAPHP